MIRAYRWCKLNLTHISVEPCYHFFPTQTLNLELPCLLRNFHHQILVFPVDPLHNNLTKKTGSFSFSLLTGWLTVKHRCISPIQNVYVWNPCDIFPHSQWPRFSLVYGTGSVGFAGRNWQWVKPKTNIIITKKDNNILPHCKFEGCIR